MGLFPYRNLQNLPEPGRVLFIVNPGAGRGQAASVREILRKLTGTDHDHPVVETDRGGHARELAREAVASGRYDRLAAVGGDGTAMEVITGTIGSRMPVAVVPAGTGNVIAVETLTPLDLELACTLAISEAGMVPFDLGWSGGRYFAARLGVGLEADTIRGAAHGAKKRYGRLGYAVQAVTAWRARRLTRYAIAVDGQIFTRRAHTVIVTNVATLGVHGLNIGSGCSPADGRLDLCILRADSVGELLTAVSHIVTDTTLERGHWEVIPVYHGVEIRAVPRQRVQVDGEPAGQTPTMAAVLPGMARLVVPLTPETIGQPAPPEIREARPLVPNGSNREEHAPSERSPGLPPIARAI
jgi:diacylglycerol kinase family enzyme